MTDHRKINNYLQLYHIQKESLGMVFWHENGWIVFCELKKFIRKKLKIYNYKEVNSPIMMHCSLWKKTGHWKNYIKYMFTTTLNKKKCCIKPMNCVGHIQIFNQNIKSYRDLPLRIAEFGSCYRNEPSGALHGLMRLQHFTQDDAHIFCSQSQIHSEVNQCIKMIFDVYRTFGFKNIIVKFSTRPKKRIGNDKVWNTAEKKLEKALKDNRIDFQYQKGEGAFYGPKIEFALVDFFNRSWQCGTIQLDFLLAKRLNAFYFKKNNKRSFPVIIHRAILGSIERFIGILTEEYSGFYPTWLAPVQIVIVNITEDQTKYVQEIKKKLLKSNLRVKSDVENKKIGFKIRKYTLLRIPYIFVCGKKEMHSRRVSVRNFRKKDLGIFEVRKIISKIKKEIKNYRFYQKGE